MVATWRSLLQVLGFTRYSVFRDAMVFRFRVLCQWVFWWRSVQPNLRGSCRGKMPSYMEIRGSYLLKELFRQG